MKFKEYSASDFDINPFKAFDKWFLLSAGTQNSFNSMTISWGQMGIMWGLPVVTVGVRHSRYTYDFMEKNDLFVLNSFGAEQKTGLNVYGAKSGRDIDKMSSEYFTPFFTDGTVTYEQAEYAVICKKLYISDLDRGGFTGLDPSKFYTSDDDNLHRLYTGEVIKILAK